MYEDVKAAGNHIKGQFELQVAELQNTIEALKLERAESKVPQATPEEAGKDKNCDSTTKDG